MIGKIVMLVLGVLALVLNFKSKAVLQKIFRVPDPDEQEVMRVKIAALVVAVAAFLGILIIG